MDEMYNLQPVNSYPGEEPFRRPREYERKKTEVKSSRMSLRLFFEQNREIVRRLCIVLAFLIISNTCTFCNTRRNTKEEMQKLMDDEVSKTAFVVSQQTRKAVMDEFGITDEKIKQDNMDADADTLAIMLEAYAEYGNSDYGLYLIGCSAKNRQLSNKYPGDMLSVVSAPEQYMGWNKDRVPTAHTKQIAKDIEEIYDTLGAPMSTSFVHVVWTSKEVKLIDNMEKGVPTHTYYESDIEDFLKARDEAKNG